MPEHGLSLRFKVVIDGYELETKFIPVAEALRLPLTPSDQMWLRTVLAGRRLVLYAPTFRDDPAAETGESRDEGVGEGLRPSARHGEPDRLAEHAEQPAEDGAARGRGRQVGVQRVAGEQQRAALPGDHLRPSRGSHQRPGRLEPRVLTFPVQLPARTAVGLVYLGWSWVAYGDPMRPLRLQQEYDRRGGFENPVTRLAEAARTSVAPVTLPQVAPVVILTEDTTTERSVVEELKERNPDGAPITIWNATTSLRPVDTGRK